MALGLSASIIGGGVGSGGGGGTGTVTATGGALTANALVLGNGTTDTKVVAGITTDGVSELNLGVPGASVGEIVFGNATSGTASLVAPAGALGTYDVTLPNAASTLPIYGAQMTYTGPSAPRTITYPDASFTVARTDAANTFTGVQSMTSPSITTSITSPSTTFALLNVTPTTINAFGAATTINAGATGGTTNWLGAFNLNPSGSAAGVLGLGQGTAPALVANTFQFYAPTSVVAGGLAYVPPGTASTGAMIATNAAGVMTISHVAPGTSGNVLTSNGTTWASSAAAGGTPGGSGSEIQYRGGASTFSAVTNSSASGATMTLGNAEALATTPTAYLTLRNTTAAANNAQQYSPSVDWRGAGWDTAASKAVAFRAYVEPVQASTNPNATWHLQSSINAGAYADAMTVTQGGTIGATSSLYAGTGGFIGWLTGGNRSIMSSPVDGNILLQNSGATTFGLLQGGGTSASFPAWKRSTTTWQARLADDSADTGISMSTIVQSGKTTTYNGVATAGWGHPAIQSAGRVTAQTAANASVATYTVGAADGSFIISGNVLVTASTTFNFTMTCAYTDEGNTARTLTFTFSNVGGTLSTAIINTGGAVPYEGVPLHIRAKASTAITIATAAGGTYTSVTYNAEGNIRQVA